MQDRIVIFPHLLIKDSNDVYPFPMQRITDDGNDEDEAALQYAHQVVAILVDHMYFCGGVVLDASTVLTAAHCTDGAQSFKITSADQTPPGASPSPRAFTATRHEEHPHWSALTLEADIAKIYLDNEELEVTASKL